KPWTVRRRRPLVASTSLRHRSVRRLRFSCLKRHKPAAVCFKSPPKLLDIWQEHEERDADKHRGRVPQRQGRRFPHHPKVCRLGTETKQSLGLAPADHRNEEERRKGEY